MPKIMASPNIKQTISLALKKQTKQEIEKSIKDTISTSEDKIYTVRYLSRIIREIKKNLQQAELKNEQEIKVELKNLLSSYEIACNAVELTNIEEGKLYSDIDRLYAEQVKNRKWYQRGEIAVAFAIILFPLAPFIYRFWKNDRDKEEIQINPHRLADTTGKIRQHRKKFKLFAYDFILSHQDKYITEKNQINNNPDTYYVTKHKKERDKFFLKHTFFRKKDLNRKDVDWVRQSKREDEELRLSLGMQN